MKKAIRAITSANKRLAIIGNRLPLNQAYKLKQLLRKIKGLNTYQIDLLMKQLGRSSTTRFKNNLGLQSIKDIKKPIRQSYQVGPLSPPFHSAFSISCPGLQDPLSSQKPSLVEPNKITINEEYRKKINSVTHSDSYYSGVGKGRGEGPTASHSPSDIFLISALQKNTVDNTISISDEIYAESNALFSMTNLSKNANSSDLDQRWEGGVGEGGGAHCLPPSYSSRHSRVTVKTTPEARAPPVTSTVEEYENIQFEEVGYDSFMLVESAELEKAKMTRVNDTADNSGH